MSDLMRWASDWKRAKRKETLASDIQYRRGSDTIDIRATLGHSEHESINSHGVVDLIRSRDFIIDRADLTFGGVHVEPQRGDLIVLEIDGTSATFEVFSPDGSESAFFTATNKYETVWRVHTKRVEA